MNGGYEHPGPMTGGWGRLPRAVRALLVLTASAFVLQGILEFFAGELVLETFGLSYRGIRHGFLWQPLTYLFMHGGFFHLLMNLLVLYFLGPETERFLGARSFLGLYLVSGLLGGVGWLLMENSPWATCIGASGAVFGIIGAFAALFPDQPVTLLVFFVLPITLRAWVLAVLLGLMELMFLLSPHQGGVAYAAHLAGGVAGYLYARMLLGRGRERGWGRSVRRWIQRSRPEKDSEAYRRQMDKLLDKIAAQGIGSLTRREREWLEHASRARRESPGR